MLENLQANAELAAATLQRRGLGASRRAERLRLRGRLRHAIITPLAAIAPEARARAGILLDKYLPR